MSFVVWRVWRIITQNTHISGAISNGGQSWYNLGVFDVSIRTITKIYRVFHSKKYLFYTKLYIQILGPSQFWSEILVSQYRKTSLVVFSLPRIEVSERKYLPKSGLVRSETSVSQKIIHVMVGLFFKGPTETSHRDIRLFSKETTANNAHLSLALF